MERLTAILGAQRSLEEVNLALRYQVEHFRPAAVGAIHITCSDETEAEAARSFQDCFVEHLLPELKTWRRSPFRSANLGARYEWGAVRIAEAHFALRVTASEFKILLVKINSHVALNTDKDGVTFGAMHRYNTESNACGALGALLDGARGPFSDDLQRAICFEGVDRVSILRNSDVVDPDVRMLFAAIVNAKSQARMAILDIQDYTPVTPTLYIVLPCVTLNHSSDDTELTCGYYLADFRGPDASIVYRGLGDDPTRYTISRSCGRIIVEDDHAHAPRPARNHRRLVVEAWEKRKDQFDDPAIALLGQRAEESTHSDDHANRLARVFSEIESGKHLDDEYAKSMLRMLLGVLAEVSPIPAALILFGEGVAAIYHTHRMHQLARQLDRNEDARAVLDEVSAVIDQLPPQRAREVAEVLVSHYTDS